MFESFKDKFKIITDIRKRIACIRYNIVHRKELLFAEFRGYLEMENPDHICFLCGEPIADEPCLHYVIPQWLIGTDNLYNMVFAHEECSIKADENVPTKQQILKAEARNEKLLKIMLENDIDNNYTQELDYCNRFKLLRQISSKTKIYGGI
jgi:hypothetical protein